METVTNDVLVVEDDVGFFETVIRPVFAHRSILCVHNAPQAHRALDRWRGLRLALVDLNIPGGAPFSPELSQGGGFVIARRVREEFPFALSVIISAHDDPASVNAAQRCGSEFISKRDCSQNLRALADRLEQRGRSVLHLWHENLSAFRAEHGLSSRQLEVLSLAVHGLKYHDIAEYLNMSVHTVRTHIHNILDKSGYRSIKDVVGEWSED